MTDTPRSERHSITPITWINTALLLAASLYLYLNLFALPTTPFLLGGDQIFFWVYAQRMLNGEHIYRDFFQFTPPGTGLVYLALFKLFGARIWVTSAVVLLLGLALCELCFSIAKRLMRQESALLASMFFLVFVYGRLLNATHHWFSLLAVLCALRVFLPQRTLPRLTVTGALLACASFFTQTAGAAALLALLIALAWEKTSSWRIILVRQAILVVSFTLTLTALYAPLLASIGLRRLWYFQVTFPRRYLAYWFGNWFPGLPEPFTAHALPHLAPYLFIYALLPVIYPVVLWRAWRNRCNFPMYPVTLALIGLFLLLEILPAVNFLRLFCIAAPAILLLVYLMDTATTHASRLRSCITIAGGLFILGLATGMTWQRQHQSHTLATLPAGRVLLSPQKAEKFSWLARHAHPGEFLFQAAWHDTYLPLGLRNPVFLDGLIATDEARPEYLALAIRQLETRQVEYILWSPKLNFPGHPDQDPDHDHLEPFRAYLRTRYTPVHVFPDHDELWQRR